MAVVAALLLCGTAEAQLTTFGDPTSAQRLTPDEVARQDRKRRLDAGLEEIRQLFSAGDYETVRAKATELQEIEPSNAQLLFYVRWAEERLQTGVRPDPQPVAATPVPAPIEVLPTPSADVTPPAPAPVVIVEEPTNYALWGGVAAAVIAAAGGFVFLLRRRSSVSALPGVPADHISTAPTPPSGIPSITPAYGTEPAKEDSGGFTAPGGLAGSPGSLFAPFDFSAGATPAADPATQDEEAPAESPTRTSPTGAGEVPPPPPPSAPVSASPDRPGHRPAPKIPDNPDPEMSAVALSGLFEMPSGPGAVPGVPSGVDAPPPDGEEPGAPGFALPTDTVTPMGLEPPPLDIEEPAAGADKTSVSFADLGINFGGESAPPPPASEPSASSTPSSIRPTRPQSTAPQSAISLEDLGMGPSEPAPEPARATPEPQADRRPPASIPTINLDEVVGPKGGAAPPPSESLPDWTASGIEPVPEPDAPSVALEDTIVPGGLPDPNEVTIHGQETLITSGGDNVHDQTMTSNQPGVADESLHTDKPAAGAPDGREESFYIAAPSSVTGAKLDERSERMFREQYDLGTTAFDAGQWKEAVHYLSVAAAIHPDHEDVRAKLREAREKKRGV